MKARYQYRFYPTNQQRVSLAQLFGCVRVVWNDALASCQDSKFPGFNQLSANLTESKKTEQRSWLNEVSAVPLQQVLRNLDKAYKAFFKSLVSKKRFGKPRFKKKANSQSAEFTKAAFKLKDGVVYLAKIGNVSPILSREMPSEPSSVTLIKDCADRYFLSFVVEVEDKYQPATNLSVGIDLGIKTFAYLSTGEAIRSPVYKHLYRKVAKLQRKLARQTKGSRRREVTRKRISKTHNQIADKRTDFLHKLSTKVVTENQSITLEDLNVSGMVKNRKLARAISQQGWYQFRTLVEAKANTYGRNFHLVSRWEPTSQVCSDCDYRWGKLNLSIREIICINCAKTQERDLNAAKNIEKVGMGYRHDSKCTQRQSKTTSVASVSEA